MVVGCVGLSDAENIVKCLYGNTFIRSYNKFSGMYITLRVVFFPFLETAYLFLL